MQEDTDEVVSKDENYPDKSDLTKRLKEGDETAFNQLIKQYSSSLLALAKKYVRSQSSAEEVVQETWMGVFQRIAYFEGRSSLKTWIARILIHRAQTYALREQRMISFSSLSTNEEGAFIDEPKPCSSGWHSLREDRNTIPETCLLSLETRACIIKALQALPLSQRTVMVLCDIEGRRPEEICATLGLSPVNQRVLLHRARSKVRQGLETYLAGE